MPHFKYSGKGSALKCTYHGCCNMYILMFAALSVYAELLTNTITDQNRRLVVLDRLAETFLECFFFHSGSLDKLTICFLS